jgi:hypothetical protein
LIDLEAIYFIPGKKVEEEGQARGVQQRPKEPIRTGASDIRVTQEKLSDDKGPQ